MRGPIQDAFGALAKNRHRGARVQYAWKKAKQRIHGAKFHDVLDSEAASDTWGETTDTEISITRGHAWLYRYAVDSHSSISCLQRVIKRYASPLRIYRRYYHLAPPLQRSLTPAAPASMTTPPLHQA